MGREGGISSQRPGGSSQAGGLCFPLSSQKGRKKAVHLVSRASGPFVFKAPLLLGRSQFTEKGLANEWGRPYTSTRGQP